VEIGGGFRIPDVMAQSGARLVEVGTTNRTYIGDYESATGPVTAALMRVHPSNFRVTGFTESVTLPELARLARDRQVLLLDDVGSGCLIDVTKYGLAPEPLVQASLAAGADLVLFSGDKLLGGPQAGVVVGRAALIARLRRHPLARAVRMDKASIAGLAATLLHYLRGEAEQEVPVWRMISMPVRAIEQRAEAWAAAVRHGSHVIDGRSMIGGGSLPEESLPTRLLAVPPSAGRSPTILAARLRQADPSVVARIDRDKLVFDPRTVRPDEDDHLIKTILTTLD
jgi:L-seryl-tRNA(Ser) seleniumtransferase